MAGLKVPLGEIWIRADDPDTKRKTDVELRCLLGETEPKVIAGRYGGWQIVPRERRIGLTQWKGTDPLLIEITLMIDDFRLGEREGHGVEVEAKIRALERMAGLDNDPEPEEPMLLRWDANAPHDYHEAPHIRWFIESLTWGRALRNDSGNRVRQEATIQVRQYVQGEFLGFDKGNRPGAGAARNRSKKKKNTKTTHVVRKGESLQDIAKKRLGKSSRWGEIYRLNKDKVRDPRNPRDNITLRLPKK